METEKIIIEGIHYRKCAYDKSYAVELVPGKFKGVKDFRLLTKTHFINGETDTETVITMDAYEITALYDALCNAKHLFENPIID